MQAFLSGFHLGTFLHKQDLLFIIRRKHKVGLLGGSVGEVSDFRSGHDLAVREFEPRVGLCADSSEPGARFQFCVSLSLSAPPPLVLCLSLSKISKYKKKI